MNEYQDSVRTVSHVHQCQVHVKKYYHKLYFITFSFSCKKHIFKSRWVNPSIPGHICNLRVQNVVQPYKFLNHLERYLGLQKSNFNNHHK